jgi:hypothetical protein
MRADRGELRPTGQGGTRSRFARGQRGGGKGGGSRIAGRKTERAVGGSHGARFDARGACSGQSRRGVGGQRTERGAGRGEFAAAPRRQAASAEFPGWAIRRPAAFFETQRANQRRTTAIETLRLAPASSFPEWRNRTCWRTGRTVLLSRNGGLLPGGHSQHCSNPSGQCEMVRKPGRKTAGRADLLTGRRFATGLRKSGACPCRAFDFDTSTGPRGRFLTTR